MYSTTILPLKNAESIVSEWELLSSHAVEPNPYFTSWFLSADAHREGDLESTQLLLAWKDGFLVGLLPFRRKASHRRLPLAVIELRSTPYLPLSTPLLRSGHAEGAADAMVNWLYDRSGAHLVRLPMMAGDGEVARALSASLRRRRAPRLEASFGRALFEPRGIDGESYLARSYGGTNGSNLRRRRRNLEKQGEVQLERCPPDASIDSWIEEFLTIEASGWKGREGGALLPEPSSREFITFVMKEAHRRGQLQLYALRLGGKAIAMVLMLLSGRGAFALKSAYDESLSKFAPGMQLRAEYMRAVTAPDSAVDWVDSCTTEPGAVDETIWTERRMITEYAFATRTLAGRMAIAAIRLLRQVKIWIKSIKSAQVRSEKHA